MDTNGCMLTGECDVSMLRVDRKMFESGKKKLQVQKYPETCGHGFNFVLVLHCKVIK